MKRLVVLLPLLLLVAPAWSSKIIGNGGDVVVCPNEPRVSLLDFVESRVLRKKSIRLAEPLGKTYLDKLAALITKVQGRFPLLAEELRTEIANFEDKSVREYGIELEDINDSYHKLRLPGCHVEQIANQSKPLFDDDPWFLIDAHLWDQLSEFDRAGLIVHEVLYRMGLRYGLEHSIGIRYLVALLFHEEIDGVSDTQWVQAFTHSRIKLYETGGFQFPLFQGKENSCEVVPGAVNCSEETVIKPARISFQPDRRLRSIEYADGEEKISFRAGPITGSVMARKVTFDWGDRTAAIIVEGRLLLEKRRNRVTTDIVTADVRGKINPYTGTFHGTYRIVREDLTKDLVERKAEAPMSLNQFFDL